MPTDAGRRVTLATNPLSVASPLSLSLRLEIGNQAAHQPGGHVAHGSLIVGFYMGAEEFCRVLALEVEAAEFLTCAKRPALDGVVADQRANIKDHGWITLFHVARPPYILQCVGLGPS